MAIADYALDIGATQAPAAEERKPIGEIVKSRWFWLASAVFLGLGIVFLGLIRRLDYYWFGDDSYYSHGPLVPLIAGYIVYSNWDRISRNPVRGFWPAIFPVLGLLYVVWVANKTDQVALLSVMFVACASLLVWFIAGFRWALATAPAIGYLLFGLPIWASFIDAYTYPLQEISTKASFQILKALQLNPLQLDNTTILLNNFSLDVGVPCSGLKLVLSLGAFLVFFMLIARLKLWANVLLAFITLPLAIMINGLRIAMIGVVGNRYGTEAGLSFHDYSGYISLIVCFVILMKITRALGWK